jgi:hypothetical protein
MGTHKLLALALAAGLLLSPAPASAGPWTKSLKQVYVKLGQGFFISDSFVDSTGVLQEGTNYLGATTSIYFETGLWDKLHIQGYMPYVVAINDEGKQKFMRVSGGDMLLALQYGIPIPVSFPIAVKVEFKVPLYDAGSVKGDFRKSFPIPGDGQLDITFWLGAGASLGDIPLFFFAEVGYRLRTEAYVGDGLFDNNGNTRALGDGIAYFAQVGYTFFKRVTLAVNTGGILSFAKDQYTKSYVTVGPSLFIPIKWGLAAEASFDPVVYAYASAPGMSFTVGLSYNH